MHEDGGRTFLRNVGTKYFTLRRDTNDNRLRENCCGTQNICFLRFCALLDHYSAYIGNLLGTFRDNLLVSSLKGNKSNKIEFFCPFVIAERLSQKVFKNYRQTLRNYRQTLRNYPHERRSLTLGGRILKSLKYI